MNEKLDQGACLALRAVAEMPAYSIVHHLLQGIPVWAEFGLAVLALMGLTAFISRSSRPQTSGKSVVVVDSAGGARRIEGDLIIVQVEVSARRTRSAKVTHKEGSGSSAAATATLKKRR
jgi:hypothetical protein